MRGIRRSCESLQPSDLGLLAKTLSSSAAHCASHLHLTWRHLWEVSSAANSSGIRVASGSLKLSEALRHLKQGMLIHAT